MRNNGALIVMMISAVFASGVTAQEIGVAAGKSWNSDSRLGSPGVFGIYIQHTRKISFRLEYNFSRQRMEDFGTLSSGFLPPPKSVVYENIASVNKFHTLEISMQFPYLYTFAQHTFGAGFGFTMVSVSSSVTGQTTGKTYEPLGSSMMGIFYSLRISRENVFGLPVNLGLMFKHKFLSGPEQAVTDVARALQPLSGDNTMKTLELFAGYHF